jgi:hypothetical protein
MIIYCAGPIRGDTTFQANYLELIKIIESLGHTPLAELNGKFNSSIPLSENQIYTRDLKWLKGSQLMIAEISAPSLGVGFEISYALFQKEIPVLALASGEVNKLSAMIAGCDSSLLTLKRYNDIEDMQRIISEYIKNLEQKSDGRKIRFSVHKKTR